MIRLATHERPSELEEKKYLRESLKGQWIAPFSGYRFAVKRNRGHCSFETLRDHLEVVHVRQSIAKWEILLHANLNCMARNFYTKGYDYFEQLLEFDWSWLDLIHDSFHFLPGKSTRYALTALIPRILKDHMRKPQRLRLVSNRLCVPFLTWSKIVATSMYYMRSIPILVFFWKIHCNSHLRA